MAMPADPKSSSPSRTDVSAGRGRWLVAILLLALGLRILYLLQARGWLFFNAFSDSLYYHQWALRILEGQHGPQVFYLGPLYPYLLAFWYGLFGPYVEVFLWFQAILGTLSCGLLYLLGRSVFRPAVGLLAAFLGAIYQVEIFYEGLLLTETVLFVLNLLLFVSISWALRRNGLWRWAICGLLLGLSALGRTNMLGFLPFLLIGFFLWPRKAGQFHRRRWRCILAVLVGVLVVVIPVTFHNYRAGQDVVLITSNLGINFFIGNHPDAQGYYVKPRGLDLSEDIYGTKIANVYAGRSLKPSQVSNFWLQRGLDFITANPAAFLKLSVRKAVFFWNAYEIPQVENIYFLKRFVPLLRWPLLGFSILGPVGLLGMVLSLRRWRESYFLLAAVLALMGSTIFFFVISRLRLHICSTLLVFMAYALIWAWERIKGGQYRSLLLAVAGTAALAVFVNWPFSALRPHEQMAQTYRFYALHLRNQGRLTEAAEEYERAIEIDPQLADTYVDFAALRLAEDRREEAWKLFQRALQVNPQVSGVHQHFGNLHAQMGSWDEAIAEFRAETKVSPYSFKTYESLYRALGERGQKRGEGGDKVNEPAPQN